MARNMLKKSNAWPSSCLRVLTKEGSPSWKGRSDDSMTDLPPSDAANTRRWDGRTGGRYEVWYATFNHGPTGTGYWIR